LKRGSICHLLHAPRRAATFPFLLIIASSLSAQDAPTELSKVTIQGVVLNNLTREPVAHALVSSPDNRLATLTDDQGRFEFSFPALSPDPASTSTDLQSANSLALQLSSALAFTSILTARKPGFLDPQRHPQLPPVDLAAHELTLTLVPEALIVGRVVLPNSNTADRIQLELYRRNVSQGQAQWAPAGSVTSRSTGEFRFADLEAGTYKLFTRELMDRDPLTFDPRGPFYGYPPAYFPNATDFESAATIQLTAGATFQAELTPERQAYYSVKVPVTNASSDTQLMVKVFVHGRKGPGFELGYNNRDQKIEGSLPNGTYVISATSVGPTYAQGQSTLTVKSSDSVGSPLTLAPLATVRINAQQDFKPDPNSDATQDNPTPPTDKAAPWRRSTLNVRLERAEEIPPSNDFAQLRPPSSPTDDSLIFDNVAPGRYWVRVESARGFASSISAGDLDLLRHPLNIGPGANLTIDLTVRDDGAEIHGSIEGLSGPTEADNSPQNSLVNNFILRTAGRPPAYVYLIPLLDSAGQFREIPVSSEGKFDVQQVPPGTYQVLAFDRAQPEFEYRNPEALRAYDTKGQVIRLSAGQKETLSLPLIPTNN